MIIKNLTRKMTDEDQSQFTPIACLGRYRSLVPIFMATRSNAMQLVGYRQTLSHFERPIV